MEGDEIAMRPISHSRASWVPLSCAKTLPVPSSLMLRKKPIGGGLSSKAARSFKTSLSRRSMALFVYSFYCVLPMRALVSVRREVAA